MRYSFSREVPAVFSIFVDGERTLAYVVAAAFFNVRFVAGQHERCNFADPMIHRFAHQEAVCVMSAGGNTSSISQYFASLVRFHIGETFL